MSPSSPDHITLRAAQIIDNKNSGLIIARGVYEKKMGISLSVVTHAAATEHCHRGGTDYGDCSYRARTTPLG